MPTTSWATMRDEITQPFFALPFATTTDITGSDTSVVSTELANRFTNDDMLIGKWCIIEGGNNADVIRQITDYANSTGTLTLAGANLTAESGAVNCAVHEFHPDDVRRHFNRARVFVYPSAGIVRDYQLLVTGPWQREYQIPSTVRDVRRVSLGHRVQSTSLAHNLLSDPGFEDWSSITSLTEWDLTGVGASVNQEEETTTPSNYAVLEGQYSALILSDSNNDTTLLQSILPDVGTGGMEIHISIWAYSTDSGGRVKARIEGGGVSAVSQPSGGHGGTGWERLTASTTFTAGGTSADVGIIIEQGATIAVYVDEAICTVGPSEPLEGFWEPVYHWEIIPAVGGAGETGRLYVPHPLPEKQILRLIGTDLLSSVSSDSDTVEVDGEQLELLYAKTREYMCEERGDQTFGDMRIHWKTLQSEYSNKYRDTIEQGRGLRVPPRTLRDPMGVW